MDPDALDSVAAARAEYTRGGLVESDLLTDPIAMFRRWYDDAHAAGLHEPNAMVVATVSGDFAPAARLVLLKGVSEEGFVFYTNTGSRKGTELAGNPRIALLFPWHPLERQVRVDGTATPPPARRRRRLLRGPSARVPARRLGVAPVQRRLRPGGAARGVRRRGAALRRGRGADARRSGAATSCTPSRWSSGRAGRAGCTTGWSTGVRRTAGAPSGSPRSGQIAHSDHARPRRRTTYRLAL